MDVGLASVRVGEKFNEVDPEGRVRLRERRAGSRSERQWRWREEGFGQDGRWARAKGDLKSAFDFWKPILGTDEWRVNAREDRLVPQIEFLAASSLDGSHPDRSRFSGGGKDLARCSHMLISFTRDPSSRW